MFFPKNVKSCKKILSLRFLIRRSMDKKLFAITISLLFALSLMAQEEKTKFSTKFYGFVRGDFAYDTRQSVSANEGLFHLYPKDKAPDANGEDLNKVSNSGFYLFNSF